MKLKDQVAIVTGAARGNGFAIARALASEGCNVVLTDICADIATVPYKLSTRAELDGAVQEIAAMGVKAHGIVCDVRSDAAVKAMVAEVVERFGKVDVAVANAGVTSLIPVAEMDEATYKEVLEQIREAGYDPGKLIKTLQSPRNGQPAASSLSN